VSASVQEKVQQSPPKRDLSGLMPYLRRYVWAIVLDWLACCLWELLET